MDGFVPQEEWWFPTARKIRGKHLYLFFEARAWFFTMADIVHMRAMSLMLNPRDILGNLR